jgi:hypothetical protein
MDLQGILEVFFNNPLDDEYDNFQPQERERHTRIPYFFENIVLTYSLTGKIKEKRRKKRKKFLLY